MNKRNKPGYVISDNKFSNAINDLRNAQPSQVLDPEAYRLQTKEAVTPVKVENVGSAHMVDRDNFPVLDGITCYTVEIWEECMRLPHWHPNASELGYVISGTIEVLIWRSPGETAVLTLTPGMCWFIPQSALHSLNNIGQEHAKLLVGFSSDRPQDIDLPTAFNGIPAPIRDAYTSPHAELRQWVGITTNPLLGHFSYPTAVHDVIAASPYGFDFAAVPPLFSDPEMGSVIWGIKDNWNILKNISVLRAHLKPGIARDAIWYPDAGTLYVVAKGTAQFHLVMADHSPTPLEAKQSDYIFVPSGVLHTFLNLSAEDFEVIAFFTKVRPLPEVSLSVATAFFPQEIRKAAMTQYGNENKPGDPLQHLNFNKVSPFLLRIR